MKVYQCTDRWRSYSKDPTWQLDFSKATHVRVWYGSDLFDLEFSQNGQVLGQVPINDAFSMWALEEDIPLGLKRLLRELRLRRNKEHWLDYREPLRLTPIDTAWVEEVITSSGSKSLKLSGLKTQPERVKFLKQRGWFTTRLNNADEDTVIECWHPKAGLVGLLVLEVDWQRESFRLHLKIKEVRVESKFKRSVQKAFRALSYGFNDAIFEHWKHDNLPPVVIVDIADEIEDALQWRHVLSHEFEHTQGEGDLVLVSRGGDLITKPSVTQMTQPCATQEVLSLLPS